jgi:hypothetical protein
MKSSSSSKHPLAIRDRARGMQRIRAKFLLHIGCRGVIVFAQASRV